MLSHPKSSDLHCRPSSLLFLASENSNHFLAPPLVSPWNDIWGMTADLGSASDLFETNLKAQPIRSTTQIWVDLLEANLVQQPIRITTQIWGVTCQQYGISSAVPQMWFCRESSASAVKWCLFSQATLCLVYCAFDMAVLCLPHTWQLTTQLVVNLLMPEPYIIENSFDLVGKDSDIKHIILLNEPTF